MKEKKNVLLSPCVSRVTPKNPMSAPIKPVMQANLNVIEYLTRRSL